MNRRAAFACITFAGVLAAGVTAPAAAATTLPQLTLDVSLDPATRAFAARAALQPRAARVTFTLHESLALSAARSAGQAVAFRAGPHRHGLRQWQVDAVPGAELVLDYRGTLPAPDPALDHRGVLQALPPMAAPAGSFLPAGSGWYPDPGAPFTYRVALTVAGEQRALVAGELEDETLPAAPQQPYRARYRYDHPADGVELMAGPWRVRERRVERADGPPLRLRTWFPADADAEPGLAQAWLDDSARHIADYSAQIGPYPHGSFSVVAAALPTGFGMPTLTYLGADLLRLPFIRATSLGHEVLHNWWGNGVRIDPTDGNWAEGLTTFMADHAYKEAESGAAAAAMRLGWLRDFAAVPAAERRPLAAFRSRTHGAAAAVGYGKSAMLFVMLRDLIGDDAFRRGVRHFWHSRQFREAGWVDLRASFEAASGRDLGAFFAAWLTRADAPAPAVTEARARRLASGRFDLALTLTQAAPPYPLRLPLEVRDAAGNTTRHWVELDGVRSETRLELDALPLTLRLDPEAQVWRELDRSELPPILRQWIVARRPRLTVLGDEPAFGAAAGALAARLFEQPATTVAAAQALDAGGDNPLLLIGRPDAIDAALAAAGLPPRPAQVGRRGSAQVWTVARGAGAPLAVVSAADAAALQALLRPLPHYGAQSWLAFDGARAIARGAWPLQARETAVVVQP